MSDTVDPKTPRNDEGFPLPPRPPSPAPSPPLDTKPDAYVQTVAKPDPHVRGEFPASTHVIYVNGINSNEDRAVLEGRALAHRLENDVEVFHVATRGIPTDIAYAAGETFSTQFGDHDAPERALSREIVADTRQGENVHLVGYSRGALVCEGAIRLARAELKSDGFSDAAIDERLHSHVTLETFNGASHDVDPSVRAVHYVNSADYLVGQSMGMGGDANVVRAAIAGGIGTVAADMISGYEAREGPFNRPNGPVFVEPAEPTSNPLVQHDFRKLLEHRQGFESSRAPYEAVERERMSHVPTPQSGAAPATLSEASHPNAQHVTAEVHPDPRPGSEPFVDQTDEVRRARPTHNANGIALPPVSRVEPWDGSARSGTMFPIDDRTAAMSVGRGTYMTFDVARDLHGMAPLASQTVQVDRAGAVQGLVNSTLTIER